MRPIRIKVLGKPFTIKWLTEGMDNTLVGECDYDRQTISIRDAQPLEQEQDTLLHEVIHAIDESMGLKMREAQVKGCATGLLAVLKDNPRFAAFLRRKNNGSAQG